MRILVHCADRSRMRLDLSAQLFAPLFGARNQRGEMRANYAHALVAERGNVKLDKCMAYNNMR